MLKDKGTLLSLSLVTSLIVIGVSGTQLISKEDAAIKAMENQIYDTKREINASERNVKDYESIVSFLDDFEYSKEYFDSSLNLLHQLKSLEQLMFKYEVYNVAHEVNDVRSVDDFVEGSISTSVKAPLTNVLSFLGELYGISPSPTIESFELKLKEEEFLSSNSENLVANINLIYRSKSKDLSGFEAYNFDGFSPSKSVNPFGYYTVDEPEKDPLEEYSEGLKSGQEDEEKILSKSEIIKIVETEAASAGVDKNLALALIEMSSNFNPQITLTENRIEYRGLMGINPETAPWFAENAGIEYEEGIEHDPIINIKMGVFYLKYLEDINPNKHYIVSAYHYGPEGAKDVMEKGTYETEFSRRVLNTMNSKAWEEGK